MKHHFVPDNYYTTLGSHEPSLRVARGDTIITTALDAFGRDAQGELVGPSGNPQTGTFYVEGAEPGDTLVVRIDNVWPNRNYGQTRPRIAQNVLDPQYTNIEISSEFIHFEIDQVSKTAKLQNAPPGLADLTVPLRPMLGCFGVAPDGGQAISTATSGPHGGNMDYNGFVSGTTAYLPVFVKGALLHVGDGHAWQGDGEILGAGIEISMDITVTVDTIKGKRIGWPRGESDTHIFSVGNARPLDQAVQHATTEMLRWLQEDYGFNATEANIWLGTYAEYDVGNVIDPAFTMVCKLPKKPLQSRKTA